MFHVTCLPLRRTLPTLTDHSNTVKTQTELKKFLNRPLYRSRLKRTESKQLIQMSTIGLSVIFGTIGSLSIVNNFLLLVVILWNTSMLKTPYNILVLSLALTDFITGWCKFNLSFWRFYFHFKVKSNLTDFGRLIYIWRRFCADLGVVLSVHCSNWSKCPVICWKCVRISWENS